MRFILPAILLLACCAQAAAPLARNVVEQEGGADAAQYLRRTVTWWPRLNQDTTKPPADGMRLWRPKEGKPFKAAWVQTLGRNSRDGVLAAVLLTEDGRKRAVPLFEVDRGDKRVWKLDNGESIEDEPTYIFRPLFSDEGMAYVKSRGAKAASTAKSVKYADQWDRYKKLDATARSHINEGRTPHFRILWGDAMPKGGAGRLFFSPDFRKMNFDYVEQIWDFFSVDMGAQMPYARKDEKFKINVYTFSTGLPGMGGGWAYGAKQLLMNPGAMREGSSVIPHEFNHCLQFHSPAFRNKHSGWFWECHANWGTHQFIPNLAPVLALYANTAHFDIRSNRHHYGNWMFVQCMAENPLMGTAFCYGIWYTADPKKEDPFIVIMRFGREKGLWKNGPKGFGDVIGEMAARNVTWDYVHQRAYATAMARASSSSIAGHDRTVLEPAADRDGWFRPPMAFAPMEYGYNIIELVPDQGAKQAVVDFQGIVDADEHSDWRAALVAVNADGHPRYSRMWNKGKESLALTGTERGLFLAVAATPRAHRPARGWGKNAFHTKPRFPYEVALTGCTPSTRRPGHPARGDVAGAPHANGGGFVAKTAKVDATAYVGKNALALDRAQVVGNARIEGHAVVKGSAKVSDRAVVSDYAVVDGAQVSGNARVRDSAHVRGNTKVRDNARVLEFARVNGGILSGDATAKGFSVLDTGGIEVTGSVLATLTTALRPGKKVKRLAFGRMHDQTFEAHIPNLRDGRHLYANWNCDRANSGFLKDAYGYNDGILRGGPTFETDGGRKVMAFDGKGQYVLIGGDVLDFEEMTLDVAVKWAGGKGGTILTVGDVALAPADSTGKLAFGGVRGKAALPTGRWVRVRVECKAGACTLFVNGKQVGSGKIAANRRATHGILGRFQGRLDHVRIYRKVFDDFSTVPAPPGPQWRNGVYTEADVAALQKKLDQVRRTTAERLKNDPEWKRMHDDRNTAHKALDAMIKADPAYVAASERMDETGRTLQKLYQKEIDAGKHKNHEEARQAVRKTPKGAPLWTEHQAAGRKMEDIRKKCRTTPTGKKLWARVEAHGPAVNAYRARVAPEEATIDDRLRAARDYLREPDIPLYTGRTK